MSKVIKNQAELIAPVLSLKLPPAAIAGAVVGTLADQEPDWKAVLVAAKEAGAPLTEDVASAIAEAIQAHKAAAAARGSFVAKIIAPRKLDNGNQIPALVTFSGGSALAYKPKNLSPRLLLTALDHADEVRRVCEQAIAEHS